MIFLFLLNCSGNKALRRSAVKREDTIEKVNSFFNEKEGGVLAAKNKLNYSYNTSVELSQRLEKLEKQLNSQMIRSRYTDVNDMDILALRFKIDRLENYIKTLENNLKMEEENRGEFLENIVKEEEC